MKSLKYLLLGLLFCGGFYSCNYHIEKLVEVPTSPLIKFSFENEIANSGALDLSVRGRENVSYTGDGVEGQALDLSASAKFRKPLILTREDEFRWSDYPGLTVLMWVKMKPYDPNEYTIVSQMTRDDNFGRLGWSVENTASGSWRWTLTDGVNSVTYEPTAMRQPVNDDAWHQIGFSLNFADREVRLFYDGLNVAGYSVGELNLAISSSDIYLGRDPFSVNPIVDVWNGKMDEFVVWSRVLTPLQVKSVYVEDLDNKPMISPVMIDSITVMTWNIWDGGTREGKYVGPARVAEIIRDSGADLVSIQEGGLSGPLIADLLGFYFYRRGDGIDVLSRYPMGKTYNIYRSSTAGAVTIELPEDNKLIFCPVSLSYAPNQEAYLLSGQANPDTVISRELQTRGAEVRYLTWELQALLANSDKVPVVLAGELNSGSHLDWTDRNKKNHFGLVVKYPVTTILEEAGFIDVYRSLFPNEVSHPGYTWSPLFKTVFKDRLDYVFYQGSTIVPSSAWIVDEHPLGFPSDHAALVTSFKWK